jgi:hypothetical protein
MSCSTDFDCCKWQTRPLVTEEAPHRQNRNCLTVTRTCSLKTDWPTDRRSQYDFHLDFNLRVSLKSEVSEWGSWATRVRGIALSDDCHQIMSSGCCNKLRRLGWVTVIRAALELPVITSCKYAINSITNQIPACIQLTRDNTNKNLEGIWKEEVEGSSPLSFLKGFLNSTKDFSQDNRCHVQESIRAGTEFKSEALQNPVTRSVL